MKFSGFLLNRILITIATLFLATTFIFLIIHLIPGDPIDLILAEHFSEESYEALAAKLGLDRPLIIQYWNYLTGLLRGNWGTSFRTGRDIRSDLLANFPFTVHLALTSISLAMLIGIPAGIISAVRRNSWVDRIAMLVSLIGVCMPGFWLGVVLMLLFSLYLGLLPSIGIGSGDIFSTIRHLILPSLVLGLASGALLARITRSALLDTLSDDYIRTARAKGLRNSTVLRKHALRNALIPVVTVIGLDLGSMLAGTTIVEIVFSRPGVGHMLIEGILARDYPQIQGTLLFYLIVIIIVNTLVDLLYGLIDPRIRYT
jgi:peptide/nickel transport system permease protein